MLLTFQVPRESAISKLFGVHSVLNRIQQLYHPRWFQLCQIDWSFYTELPKGMYSTGQIEV
jgi:hypothetical protein